MGIKLNKVLLVFFLVLFSFEKVISQNDYNIVSIDSLEINNFRLTDNLEKFKKIFGKPIYYKEYIDEAPSEGYGKYLFFKYSSIDASFAEYYGNLFLSNITIKNRDYKLKVGKDLSFQIDDTFNVLKIFGKSYNQYFIDYKEQKVKITFFNVRILIKKNAYEYMGIMTFKIENNLIKEIFISLAQDV